MLKVGSSSVFPNVSSIVIFGDNISANMILTRAFVVAYISRKPQCKCFFLIITSSSLLAFSSCTQTGVQTHVLALQRFFSCKST